jgi:hypothetical protein
MMRLYRNKIVIGRDSGVNLFGGAGVPEILFLDTFTGTNDDKINLHTPDTDEIGNGWSGEDLWTIQSNKANNSPALSGTELHTSANAASDPNSNEADAITGWDQAGLTGTGANVFESQGAVKDVGSYAFHMDSNDTPTSNAGISRDITGLDDGIFINWSGRAEHSGIGDHWNAGIGSSSVGLVIRNQQFILSTSTSFIDIGGVFKKDSDADFITINERGNNSGEVYADNISYQQIPFTNVQITTDIDQTYPTLYVRASGTIVDANNPHAGLVLCWDSQANPANGVYAYINNETGSKVLEVSKYVAGVETVLFSTAITYSAGANIDAEIVEGSGKITITFKYNGGAIDSPVEITDAGIISNTIHGILATGSTVSLDSFQINTVPF